MKKLLITLLFCTYHILAYGQCPTSGTISADCTTTGNLTINGNTITVDPGVTMTVTGTLTLKGGSTLNATDAFVVAGDVSETSGTLNTLNGGTYTVSGTFGAGNGGDFTMSGVTMTVTGSADFSGEDIIISNSTISASEVTSNLTTWTISDSDFTTTGTGGFELEDATVTNSTFDIGGTLNISNGSNSIDNSTLDVGTGYTATTGQNAVTYNGGADLTLQNGTTMDVKGDWFNNELFIDNSDVTITGTFDHTSTKILEVNNNGTLTIGGDFDNSGSGNTSVDTGGSIAVAGDYDNTGGGTTTIEDGGISVGGTYTGTAPTGSGAGGDCTSGGGGCCGSTGTCSLLPVSLTFFRAETSLNKVILHWQTASEKDNDYFNIHRSTDGSNFTIQDQVSGHGSTNDFQDYEWVDYGVNSGTYYYQLEQVDYDGQNEFFDIISVNLSLSGQEPFEVYPVPVGSSKDLYLKGNSIDTNAIKASLVTISGQTSYPVEVDSGLDRAVLKLSDLALSSGIYILEVESSGEKFSSKILVR